MEDYRVNDMDWDQGAINGGSVVPDIDMDAIGFEMHQDWLHDQVHEPTNEYMEARVFNSDYLADIPEDMVTAAHCASVALVDQCCELTGRNVSFQTLDEWRHMILIGMAMQKAKDSGELRFGEADH